MALAVRTKSSPKTSNNEERVILAITAKGTVPRTIDGKTKCRKADLKAGHPSELMSESINKNPVTIRREEKRFY